MKKICKIIYVDFRASATVRDKKSTSIYNDPLVHVYSLVSFVRSNKNGISTKFYKPSLFSTIRLARVLNKQCLS